MYVSENDSELSLICKGRIGREDEGSRGMK